MPIDYGTHNISTSGNIVASSGNFSALTVNGNPIGEGGAVVDNFGDNRLLTSTGTVGGINAESNLTFDGTNLNLNNQTASTIASFDSSKNLVSLSTTTYPSFTELSYVKGVTSSIQTQIDGKSSTSHTHGNITSAGAIGSTANLPLITTTAGAITVGSFGSTANTFCQGNDSRLSDSRAPTGGAGGDLTGTYPNPTLTTTGVTGGTYRSVTVDTKGRITAGTNPTTLAGYGITDVGNGTLTLNVSGTGLSGSASFTANQSGNTTFTVTSNATNANTGSTIVARDASGNFSAGTITATLSGNASTATNSTQLGGVAASNYFRVDGSYPNADMNVPVEGFWHVASNAANLPDGAQYGHRWDYDHAGDGNWIAQFYSPTSGDAGLWFRQRRGGTWQTWRKFLDSTTFNSYSPTLTGGNASGTWGISISGDLTKTAPTIGYTVSGAAVSYGGHAGPQILGQGGSGAIITFHRPGAYAINLGLDTDNQVKIGGWSFGAAAYKIVTADSRNSRGATRLYRNDNDSDFSVQTYWTGARWRLRGYTGDTYHAEAEVSYADSAGSATTATSATSATTATGLNSSNYIARSGSSGNANTDFSNTPAGTVRHNGDDANLTNGPGNAWWFYDNYRHSNATNLWGTQIAWGWEDNANRLAQRNVTGGSFGAWVYYLNTGNYASIAPVSVRTLRAWGVYDGSATSANPGDGVNMGTMTRSSTATYTCNFGITLPNTNYGVLVSGQVGSIVTQTRNTGSVVIVAQNLNGVQTQAPYFTVAILDTP